MASLMSSKKSAQSFMDVVGADVASSFDRPLQYQVFSDQFHISSGGQVIQEGANIQIQIKDDNAIHYMARSGIAFDFIGAAIPTNAAALFSGLELSVGNVVVSTPFQQFYMQQKISKMGKKKLERYANGLCMKLDGYGYSPALYVNGAQTDISIIPLTYTHDNQANPTLTRELLALSNPYNIAHRQQLEYNLQRVEPQAGGEYRVKCFVPFSFLFACLQDLPDDGALYTGYGQGIKMNLRCNYSTECLVSLGLAQHNYNLANMQLVKCFSKLDQPRADLVLKSNIQLPLCRYVHWQSQVQSNVINAIYSVARDDLITGLWFGFHTNVGGQVTAEATNLSANLINNVASQYKNPLNWFVQMPIQQIDLHIGGEPVIINMQQLQLAHITSDVFGDDTDTYTTPALRSTKYAYHLDLRRFGSDLFGSSSKQTTTVQVQITLKTGPGSKTLFQQPSDWGLDAGAQATLTNFRFYSYLEILDFMECKNGVYQSK